MMFVPNKVYCLVLLLDIRALHKFFNLMIDEALHCIHSHEYKYASGRSICMSHLLQSS